MKKIFLFLTVIFFIFTGCTVKQKNKLSVATTFPASQFIASELTKDTQVNVVNYFENFPDPHEADLTTKASEDMINSDIIIYIPNAQHAVDKIVQNFSISSIKFHDTSKHPWLIPSYAISLTDKVYKKLLSIDSQNSEIYKKNYSKLYKDLSEVNNNYKKLFDLKQKHFVDTHSAFSDFADYYNLKEISINGADDESEPSLNKIREIINKIQEYKIKVVFYETDGDKKFAENIAKKANCQLKKINSYESGKENYISILNQNLETLYNTLNG